MHAEQTATRPVLKDGVEPELTPRDVPDHRQRMGAEYEHPIKACD
jgi:hypothetical protein